MAYKNTLFNTEVLKEKLLLCAKEIELLYPNEVFEVVIVGGAALMLFDNSNKMTNDIDVISVSNGKIWPTLHNYSMNGRVAAHLDSYSSDMVDRYIFLDNVNTKNVKYYICSLEDIIAAKLGANRDKDINDIQKEHIKNNINFELLDKIIYEELSIDYFSETRYKLLLKSYDKYKEWCKNGKKENT